MKTLICLIAFLAVTTAGFSEIDLPDDSAPARRPPAETPEPPSTRLTPRPVDVVPNDELGLVIDLKDGSRVVGRIAPRTTPIIIRTESIGEVKIPFDRVRGIQFTAGSPQATVTLQNGDKLQGAFMHESFKIATVFGRVSIPVTIVTRVTVSPAHGA